MIAYQLYSSRNFGTAADAVHRVSDLGYSAVEGYGALFADADARAALAAVLSETGTTMPTAHVGLDTLEAGGDIAAELAGMGVGSVFVPHIGPDMRPKDANGWRAFGARVEAAGASVRAQGLRFGWHNHDFEFEALPDGSIPMDHLLTADLDWEFDVAWCVRAKTDPLPWITKYADRITAAHVKDLAPAGEKTDEDGWSDPGTGTMDWSAISAALKATGHVKQWVMEHDNPSDDARFARAGLTLAKKEGLL